jgi:hypothetical protein
MENIEAVKNGLASMRYCQCEAYMDIAGVLLKDFVEV